MGFALHCAKDTLCLHVNTCVSHWHHHSLIIFLSVLQISTQFILNQLFTVMFILIDMKTSSLAQEEGKKVMWDDEMGTVEDFSGLSVVIYKCQLEVNI